MTKQILTRARLKKLLSYDPETGVFTWLLSRGTQSAGNTAGCDGGEGYTIVKIDRQPHGAHRLAFLYMYGAMPEEVDHVNHVRDDNRWVNLRPATRASNSLNYSRSSHNTSGTTGVCWDKRAGKWAAYIHTNGKQKRLGRFASLDDARSKRKVAEAALGYHSNHGAAA